MLERLKFWLDVLHRQEPFWYNAADGTHYALDAYNILNDRVFYRYGRHGSRELGPYPHMSRAQYVALGDGGYVDQRRS